MGLAGRVGGEMNRAADTGSSPWGRLTVVVALPAPVMLAQAGVVISLIEIDLRVQPAGVGEGKVGRLIT